VPPAMPTSLVCCDVSSEDYRMWARAERPPPINPSAQGRLTVVVHSADLNRDGKPDLMAINQDSSDLNIQLHTMSQQALVFQMINPGAG
jgi:hypothetical protein